MPTLKGVECHVETDQGTLSEWGIQRMRGTDSTFCFIESRTDTSFWITIKPNLSQFIVPSTLSKSDSSSTSNLRPGPSHSHTGSSTSNNPSERKRRLRRALSNPSLRAQSSSDQPYTPDFHLLASIYLDGKTKPERRAIVYLDEDHDFFPTESNGKINIKSRLVEGNDGYSYHWHWCFSEIGVEMLFDRLLIDNVRYREDTISEIVTALNSTKLDLEDGERMKEENKILGQILITLERVTLTRSYKNPSFRPKHHENDMEEIVIDNGADITNDHVPVTHSTALQKGKAISYNPPVIGYSSLDDEGTYFAKFQFFYRSKEKLRQYNFPGFPLSPLVLDEPINGNSPIPMKRENSGKTGSPPLNSKLKKRTLSLDGAQIGKLIDRMPEGYLSGGRMTTEDQGCTAGHHTPKSNENISPQDSRLTKTIRFSNEDESSIDNS